MQLSKCDKFYNTEELFLFLDVRVLVFREINELSLPEDVVVVGVMFVAVVMRMWVRRWTSGSTSASTSLSRGPIKEGQGQDHRNQEE